VWLPTSERGDQPGTYLLRGIGKGANGYDGCTRCTRHPRAQPVGVFQKDVGLVVEDGSRGGQRDALRIALLSGGSSRKSTSWRYPAGIGNAQEVLDVARVRGGASIAC
jgi:hypothetical protein